MGERMWVARVTAIGAAVLAVVLTWAITAAHYKAMSDGQRDRGQLIEESSNAKPTGSPDGLRILTTMPDQATIPEWLQVGIAGCGLIGLALTVWFARQAWKSSRDTGKAQTRAYLSFQPRSVDLTTNGGVTFTDSLGVVVSGSLSNSGHSPAHGFWIEFQFLQMPFKDGAIPSTQLALEKFPTVAGEIGGGEDRDQIVQAAMSMDLAALASAADEIRMIVRVHYFDVFGDNHMSEVDAWIRGIGARCVSYNQHGEANGAPGISLHWARHS